MFGKSTGGSGRPVLDRLAESLAGCRAPPSRRLAPVPLPRRRPLLLRLGRLHHGRGALDHPRARVRAVRPNVRGRLAPAPDAGAAVRALELRDLLAVDGQPDDEKIT